ncbi:MAG: DUF721 domain-containing protein [Bacteroidales bacterium]|nr:DUF721 domain-containing protein [Bacteroidales bacterium]
MDNLPKNVTRIARKQAVKLDTVISEWIRSMKLAAPLNTQRIYAAWDEATGAAPYTLRKYFRSGTLYVTINSSVIRNQLYFQTLGIIEKMNAILDEDPLFTKGNHSVGYVQKLVLK